MRNYEKDITINLCDTCIYDYPECNPEKVEFGNGYGEDNIFICSQYEKENYR